MSAHKHQIFAAITKVDDNEDGTIDVHGIASTEAKDAQGEMVTKGCMIDAIPEYLSRGTGALRAMHQPIAAGYVYKAEVNADGQTEISATVVDPVEILKVKTGTYKGFSIGGKKVPGGYDAITKIISKMKLTEISLVDSPANSEAVITMWKGEDMDIKEGETVVDVSVTKEGEAAVNALAEVINKGDISPARLVELANEEIAKVAANANKPAAGQEGVDVNKAATPDSKEAVVVPVKPAAPSEEEIKKGMYTVRSLAGVLMDIQYLTQDAIYETKSENDGSVIPAQLMAWLKSGAEILAAMTKEETDEMMAGLAEMAPATMIVETIDVGLADLELSIAKALNETTTIDGYIEAAKPYMDADAVGKALFADGATLADNKVKLTEVIAKAGARNNKTDAKKIQGMHDSAVELGADCKGMAKGEEAGDIKKVEGLTAEITKLSGENDILKKRIAEFEALPAPSKAVLRIINKADDVVIIEDNKKPDEPILKADGTLDQEATAAEQIKKIHATGGVRLLR